MDREHKGIYGSNEWLKTKTESQEWFGGSLQSLALHLKNRRDQERQAIRWRKEEKGKKKNWKWGLNMWHDIIVYAKRRQEHILHNYIEHNMEQKERSMPLSK